MKQTDKLFKEIIRISGDSYLDKYMYESGAAILEIYIDEIDKKFLSGKSMQTSAAPLPKDCFIQPFCGARKGSGCTIGSFH